MPRPAISFRLLERDDFTIVQEWLSAPHVREWWGEPRDLAGVEKEFGPCVDGVDPTLVFVVMRHDGPAEQMGAAALVGAATPIGLVQTYLLSDNPEYESAVGLTDAAGIDLFIGVHELTGIGIGSATISTFVTEVGWKTFPRAKRYMAGPSVKNLRSRRAFERSGFVLDGLAQVPGEPDPEAVMVLERPSVA
jgi:aminoglycoside 6'-N-acetyltransferase